jgi:DNA-binding IscR family transcriptional regulator
MAVNTRFAVAVHITTVLAYWGDELRTSDELAKSVNTNPVVVRRLLCLLADAGLIQVKEGKSGGSSLTRKASEITLADIYAAVDPEPVFGVPEKEIMRACPVSCRMQKLMGGVLLRVEHSLLENLRKTRLSDLLREI